MKLACQRHLDDLQKAESKDFPYRFDEQRASLPCEFMEVMPFTEGERATARGKRGNKFQLEPWQVFIVCVIFGWVRKSNGRRRFREAYVCIPRKNGKSLLASLIAFYMLVMDGETAPQIYSGATTERQAMEVFTPALRILETTPEGAELKREFGLEVHAKRILCRFNGGRFQPVVRKPGDGQGASCAIIDEYHEHPTSLLHDTMKQGQRARRQPLLFNITTAGSLIEGPCHQLQRTVEQVLEGVFPNDALFGIIFTIDVGDDWKTEEALRKANPNFGISLNAEILLQEQQDAINSAYLQNGFRTKTLNEWMNSGVAWMNMAAWDACADAKLKLEGFAGRECDEGSDLGRKIDLASRCKIFKDTRKNKETGRDEVHYTVFGRHYVPASLVNDGEHPHYAEWAAKGKIVVMPGWEILLGQIQDEIIEEIPLFKRLSIGFDPWNALQMQQALTVLLTDDVVLTTPQDAKTLSEPMKELQAAVLSGRFHHNGDAVLRFCASCVIAEEDHKDNIYPRKDRTGRNRNKIDAFSALLNGMVRAYTPMAVTTSVYESRGLREL